MKEFRILISDADIYISNTSSGIIDTPLCVQVGTRFFPDRQWTDLTYPVLCLWADNLLRNQNRKNEKYDLHFMDGPYRLHIEQAENQLTIHGISERETYETVFSYCCTYSDMLQALLRALHCLKKMMLENELFKGWNQRESILASILHYTELIQNALQEK